MEVKERNWGIDALRLFSMFLIVVMHTLNQGGILAVCSDDNLMSRIAWLIEVIAFCSVNCYALVSGYVGIKSKARVSKGILLWLQIFFYTFIITLIFTLVFPVDVNISIWYKAFFPILSREYWYITCYFLLYLLIPFLNAGIENLSRKETTFIIGCLCALSVILPMVLKIYPFNFNAELDAFGLLNGYSVIWLILLYLIGAYLGKYQIVKKVKGWVLWIILLSAIFLTWESLFFLPKWTMKRFGEVRYTNVLLSYTSPTILAIAVCLLFLFVKLGEKRIKCSKIVSRCGKASLAVYLIHTHPLIWHRFINGYAVKFAQGTTINMVCKVMLSSIIIFSICIFIELIRELLFSCLKIEEIITKRLKDK